MEFKLPLTIALFSLFTLEINSQNLYPFKENNKWVYMNPQSQTVINPSFDDAQMFVKNLAIVRKGSQFGVINTEGNVVVPIEESEINVLHSKFVSFRKDTLWGLYNKSGKLIYTPKFTNIETLTDNYIITNQNNLKGIFLTTNEKTIEPTYQSVSLKSKFLLVQSGENVGLLDSALNVVCKTEFASIEIFDNLLLLKSKDWWALANKKGELISKHEFQTFKLLNKELLTLKTKKGGWVLYNLVLNKFVCIDEQESYSALDLDFVMLNRMHKHGIINKNGTTVLGQTFSNIHLNDGLFLVEQSNKWGLLDKTGAVLIPIIHDKLFPFKKNLSVFQASTGKGVISNKGKVLVQPKYKDIKITGNTAKCINEEGKMENFKVDPGLIVGAKTNKKNSTPTIFSKELSHNHAWIKGAGKKWGLIGHDTLFIPYRFDDIVEFDANTSIVSQKVDYRTNAKMYGYINSNKLINLTTQKLGIVNKANGQIVSQPQFWYIFMQDFENQDFARVVLEGGSMAILNKSGKLITEIITTKDKKQVKYKLDYISKMQNNVVRFCTNCYVNYDGNWENPKVENGKWGYLNPNMTLLLDPQFEKATDFSNERAIVQSKGLYGLINTNANFILKPEFQNLSFIENTNNQFINYDVKKEKFGLISEDGKIISSISYEKIFPFKEGLARVMVGGKYGFIDATEKLIIPAIYDNANDFSEGFASVFTKNRWGFVNSSGNVNILPTYITVSNFSNGLSLVFKDGKKYFINTDEKTLVTQPFLNASDFKNDFATFINEEKKVGLINSLGTIIIEPKYEEIASLGLTSLFKVKDEGEYKIFSTILKRFISKKSYLEVSNVSEGIIKVKIDNYYNFIDTLGKIIINKKYQNASDFSDGIAKVTFENKTGFISTNGFTALEFSYGNVLDFKNGFSFAEGNSKRWKIIDRNGRNVTFDQFYNPKPFQNGYAVVQNKDRKYKWVNSDGFFSFGNIAFENLLPFKDSLAKVKTFKWGIANAKGFYITTPKYDFIGEFSNNQAVVGTYSNSGILDLEGKKILEALYDNTSFIGNNIFKVEKEDAIGYFSVSENKWIRELKK